MSRKVVITAIARTPIGAFGGSLSSMPAPRLGAHAIQAALKRSGISGDQVSEVIMGNVLSAGLGQAPARQASIFAGIPDSVPCLTINKVCGSGMKSVLLGAQSILLGDSDVVVAGGMENMSQAPYILPGARSGLRMGNQNFVDSMVHDGLWDPYNDQHMGNCGDLCAKERDFTREQQDEFAKTSFERAQAAQASHKFDFEIEPISIPGRKGQETIVKDDEGPQKVKFEKIPELRPAFGKDGTVTAANASSINDGAAALVLMSEEKAKELGCKPLAQIVSYGSHAQAPEWFTTAPGAAMNQALERAGWSVGDVDYFEVNEAFAVVAMAAERELGIDRQKLNPWGGAISLGHPIGASGARIIVTLLSSMIDQEKSKGCAGICIGGGEATAICIERI